MHARESCRRGTRTPTLPTPLGRCVSTYQLVRSDSSPRSGPGLPREFRAALPLPQQESGKVGRARLERAKWLRVRFGLIVDPRDSNASCTKRPLALAESVYLIRNTVLALGRIPLRPFSRGRLSLASFYLNNITTVSAVSRHSVTRRSRRPTPGRPEPAWCRPRRPHPRRPGRRGSWSGRRRCPGSRRRPRCHPRRTCG